jgi:hypothetical protein
VGFYCQPCYKDVPLIRKYQKDYLEEKEKEFEERKKQRGEKGKAKGETQQTDGKKEEKKEVKEEEHNLPLGTVIKLEGT